MSILEFRGQCNHFDIPPMGSIYFFKSLETLKIKGPSEFVTYVMDNIAD
jgi:hypothetical protein